MMIKFGKILSLSAAVCIGSSGAVIAQDGNSIIVQQTGESNSLRVDQSAAQNSLVAGVPPSNNFGLQLDPASDEGSFFVFGDVGTDNVDSNTLSIVDSGTAAIQDGTNNSADITLSGAATFAGLRQVGDRNNASITVGGGSSSSSDNSGGIIVQQGDDNIGSVRVDGTNAFGELIQIGDTNDTAFTVTSPNSNVSFTVIGNNINSQQQQLPASVATTSGGQVTIVQRQLGNFN